MKAVLAAGKGFYPSLDVEEEMPGPSTGLQTYSPPFETARGDATELSGSNLLPEASQSGEEPQSGSAGASSTEEDDDEDDDDEVTVEVSAELMLSEVEEIAEIVDRVTAAQRYPHEFDGSLQAALEGFVQDGGAIQVFLASLLVPSFLCIKKLSMGSTDMELSFRARGKEEG